MPTFRPGQKVKRVRALQSASRPSNAVPIGAEGVFVHYDTYIYSTWTADCVICVNGEDVFALSANWEPVQYDGNQVSTWDVGVWKPEHMREKIEEPIAA